MCGPHRAALCRGGKRAKRVLKIYVKIQIVPKIHNYVFTVRAMKTKHYSYRTPTFISFQIDVTEFKVNTTMSTCYTYMYHFSVRR